jgi:glycine/D-amino acid oxidase-like deaminating enzyme
LIAAEPNRDMSVEIRDIARAPVIVGAGVAGLMTALRLAPLPVVVLAKTRLAPRRRAAGRKAAWRRRLARMTAFARGPCAESDLCSLPHLRW